MSSQYMNRLCNCFLYNFSYATHILHNVSTGCYWYAYSSSKIMQRCHWYGYNSFHIKIGGIMSDNIAVKYIQSDTYSQLHTVRYIQSATWLCAPLLFFINIYQYLFISASIPKTDCNITILLPLNFTVGTVFF